jgi:hypothetical protein
MVFAKLLITFVYLPQEIQYPPIQGGGWVFVHVIMFGIEK